MRRLVFISLEFSAGTFSGNGVYARSQACRDFVRPICAKLPQHPVLFFAFAVLRSLQVRSLCQQQCDLLVISGKPPGYSAPDQTEGAQQLIQVTSVFLHSVLEYWSCSLAQMHSEINITLRSICFRPLTFCSSWQVQLPIWDRLDQGSGWAELAKQAAAPEVVQQVAAFHPDAILGVDWSSLPAYKALAAAFTAHKLTVPPYIYMNYRCCCCCWCCCCWC